MFKRQNLSVENSNRVVYQCILRFHIGSGQDISSLPLAAIINSADDELIMFVSIGYFHSSQHGGELMVSFMVKRLDITMYAFRFRNRFGFKG